MGHAWSRGERWAAGLALAGLALVVVTVLLAVAGQAALAAWLRFGVLALAVLGAFAGAWISARRT